MKIRLVDQISELERIHREREKRREYRMPNPADRHQEIVLERRQACLNAALGTLSWINGHLNIFRGYVKWVAPFVASSDDWNEPPHIAELEVRPTARPQNDRPSPARRHGAAQDPRR